MRKNYKLKLSYNLRENFGSYLNSDKLKNYYNFNSNQASFTNLDIPNLSKSSLLNDDAIAYSVRSAEDSPYQDVLYTSLLEEGNSSYYKIHFPYDQGARPSITIAGWYLIPNKPTGQTVLFSKVGDGAAFTSEGEQKLAYNHSTKKLEFAWRGTSDVTLSTVTYHLGPSYTVDSNWIHVAVSILSTSKITTNTAISDVIKIYVNGEFKQDDSSGTGGDVMSGQGFSASWSAADYNGNMTLGRGQDDDASSPGDGKFSIYDFAIWDEVLTQKAIKSIYSTSKYHESSGILTAPVRVQIADSRKIGPVNITRPTMPLANTNTAANMFNDVMTPVFLPEKNSDSSILLRYPLGLPESIDENIGGVVNSPIASSSIYTPNEFPDIIAPGSGTLIAEYYSVETRGHQQDQTAQGEALISPFNEDTAIMPKNDSFHKHSYPGFEGNIKDKVQINLELPMNQNAVVGRHSAWFKNYSTHHDGDGEYYNKDLTGFLYYNSVLGTWEQLGLNRPVSGTKLRISNTAQLTKPDTTHFAPSVGPYDLVRYGFQQFHSGTYNIMRMFYPGGTLSFNEQYPLAPTIRAPTATATETYIKDDEKLLKNVGYPMMTCGAPNGTQYHATSSQTIKMSNYISEPFLLEKVILEIPDTIAREKIVHGDLAGHPSGMVQPQRDYMFFLMRQSRQFPGDRNQPEGLDQEVSSSMRYIICSGSACFYNNMRNAPPSLTTTKRISNTNNANNTRPVPYSPKNSPAFSHDWGVNLNTSLPSVYEVSRTGSLSIPMIPAAAAQKSLGNFFVTAVNGTNNYFMTQSNWLASRVNEKNGLAPFTAPAFWPGGTSTLPIKNGTTGSRNDKNAVELRLTSNQSNSPVLWTRNSGPGPGVNVKDQKRTFFEVNLARFPFNRNFQARTNDPRSFAPLGGGGTNKYLSLGNRALQISGSIPDSFEKLNTVSPYLIFPEDEIILGVDASFGTSATLSCGIEATAPDGTDQNGNTAAINSKFVCGANNITGSILTMNAGQPIRLRLFGSRVKNQKKAPDFPQQTITQETITEPIIGKHVLDQYNISVLTENSGSYLERYMTGSMLTGEGTPNDQGLQSSTKKTSAIFETGLAPSSLSAISGGGFTNGSTRQILGIFPTYSGDDYSNLTAAIGGTISAGRKAGYPWPDPRVNGPAADRLVLTCSVPTQVTGFSFSKFYIRFWTSNSVRLKWPTVDNGTFGGSVTRTIRDDEIYIGTVAGSSGDSDFPSHDKFQKNLVSQLYRAFNGTAGAIGANSRCYFGAGITGGSADHACPNGIPGVTLSGLQYDDTSNQYIGPMTLTIDSTHGTVGNRAFIVEGIRNLAGASNWEQIIQDADADDGKPLTSSFRSLTCTARSRTISIGYANVTGSVSSVFFPTGSYFAGSQPQFALGPTGSFSGGSVDDVSFRQLAATANRRNLKDFYSFQRFTTAIDKNETYYDSLIPNISEVWRRLGSSMGRFEVTGGFRETASGQEAQIIDSFPFVGMSFGNSNIVVGVDSVLSANGRNYNENYDNSWWAAFPFEPRLNRPDISATGERVGAHKSELGRVPFSEATQYEHTPIRIVYNMVGDVFPGAGAPSYMSSSYGLDLIDAPGVFQRYMLQNENQHDPPHKKSSVDFLAGFVSPQIGIPVTMENLKLGEASTKYMAEVTAKVFYGSGDASSHFNLLKNYPENYLYPANSTYVWPLPPQGGETKGESPNGGPDENGNYQVWAHMYRRSTKPRGWKYGLRNVIPTKTSTIFRGDKFGQFRDMLEQRKYTVFQSGPDPVMSSVFVQFVQPPWLRKEASDIIAENPYETNSQNMSSYATSSLPFFDTGNAPAGETTGVEYPFGRDRTNEPPEVVYVLETTE